MNVSLATVWR